MSKRINKFDALAYAVSVLGPPHQTGKDRTIEESHGLVADAHLWELPSRWRLVVHEWSDGGQTTASGVYEHRSSFAVVRANDDGSLCPDYEEQARELIDAYVEAWRHRG